MQIVTSGTLPAIPEEQDLSISISEIGIAIDIGTTTIAVSVWSLAQRKHLATVAEKNNQIKYGIDVIRRISFATRPPLTGSAQNVESGPSALHYCVIGQLEKMLSKAVSNSAAKLPRGFSPKISKIIITGNTTMLSFVAAVPVTKMAAAPFTPGSLFDFTTTWQNVRYGTATTPHEDLDKPTAEILQIFKSSIIPDDTPVYFPPCIGAFIGADTVCAMVAASFPVPGTANESKLPILLADIGTNSEICLYLPDSEKSKGRILCTTAAAGPAFEAANISCGMSSIQGAIDKISYKNGKLFCNIIGEGNAKGICGSGIISAAATFIQHHYIDKNGMIQKEKSKLGDGSTCIELTPAVYISQQDIRNLQLAKAAVKTGIKYLLEFTEKLPVFCIAGGFGTKMSVEEACKISLIPEELQKRTMQIGNAALAGASAMLFSPSLKAKAQALKKKCIQINLAAVPDFQERFLKSIDF